MKKIVALLAAAGMAVAPVAANAQAGALSLSRVSAPMLPGLSFLQGDDEGESNRGGGSTAVILGVVLIVLIGGAAASGGGNDLPNSP